MREVVSPSFPLSLLPGQSDAGAEIAWLGTQIHFFKPFHHPTDVACDKVETVAKLVRLSCDIVQAAISALTSDWSGGRDRGNEGSTDCLIRILFLRQ